MKIENRVGVYARVSTNQQDASNQLLELRRYAQAREWQVVEYVDRGISGSEDEEKRPALRQLLIDARLRHFNTVLVWDFSRFARSLRQLVNALEEFRSLGISFVSLREGIDTSTANGRFVFGIFASLAEFERELIRERVKAGISRAKSEGKVLGRPRITLDIDALAGLKARGLSVRAIGEALAISKSSVFRVLSQKPLQKLIAAP